MGLRRGADQVLGAMRAYVGLVDLAFEQARLNNHDPRLVYNAVVDGERALAGLVEIMNGKLEEHLQKAAPSIEKRIDTNEQQIKILTKEVENLRLILEGNRVIPMRRDTGT